MLGTTGKDNYQTLRWKKRLRLNELREVPCVSPYGCYVVIPRKLGHL